MKTFLPLLAAVALTASAASAQITVLSEDFSTWPPTGWTTTAVAGTGWIHDTAVGRAWHEDEILQSDSRLTTPALDLSALSSVYLHFDGETNWAQYLANHPSSVGNGVSTMEVSTDGGVTWTVAWTDTSLNNFDTYSPVVDLSAYAGMTGVLVSVHFYGDFAQEWWVDNMVVDNNPGAGGGPFYAISNLVAGQTATFSVTGATPFGPVTFLYSLTGAGPTVTPFGTVDLSAPINVLTTVVADATGSATFPPTVPGGAAGATLYTQAFDMNAALFTNALSVVVQ